MQGCGLETRAVPELNSRAIYTAESLMTYRHQLTPTVGIIKSNACHFRNLTQLDKT
jgi:hypothetical protein